MNVDVKERMTLEEALKHPWIRRYENVKPFSDRRPNRMLTEAGYLADPLTLAQRLMEKLQVDLNDNIGVISSSSEMLKTLWYNLLLIGKDHFLSLILISKVDQYLNINNMTAVRHSCPLASPFQWEDQRFLKWTIANFLKNQV